MGQPNEVMAPFIYTRVEKESRMLACKAGVYAAPERIRNLLESDTGLAKADKNL